MTDIDAAVDMLNEAVTLSPGLWSLFDVQIPCSPIVGQVTHIELMAIPPSGFSFANALGLINGVLGDPSRRISIVVENVGGIPQRKFISTRVDSSTGYSDSASDQVHAEEDGA